VSVSWKEVILPVPIYVTSLFSVVLLWSTSWLIIHKIFVIKIIIPPCHNIVHTGFCKNQTQLSSQVCWKIFISIILHRSQKVWHNMI
jgi:hypothetical protein